MYTFLRNNLLSLLLVVTIVTAYDTIPGHECIRSYDGMMNSMNDLASKHSNLMTITKIGESYLKNNPGRSNNNSFDIPTDGHDIFAIVITDSTSSISSNDKGKSLFTTGVHAREYAPPELAARFIEKLVNSYDYDASVTTLLQRTEVHVVLYVNPDGRYVAEKYPNLMWRKNLNPNGGCNDDGSYGVDINRNFDFMWSDPRGSSSNPCDSDYHGKSAESEPETQALAEYAKTLFPEAQRKNDPEGDRKTPFGEEITGIFADIHASGGYVFYPWGHHDSQSPDDESLQALGRKINSYNDYMLWAGGQPDFLYEASGDTSDYMYGALGVASLGFEIGDDFYQDCKRFDDILKKNMPALMYTASIAKTPYKEVKGPDILSLDANTSNNGGEILVSAHASDSEMVNSIVDGRDFKDFATGDQNLDEVRVFLDVHPDEYQAGTDVSYAMGPTRRRLVEYIPKRTRTLPCTSYTEKKPCKRAGGGGICEWFTQTDLCDEPTSWVVVATANGAASDTSIVTSTATSTTTDATTENNLLDGTLSLSQTSVSNSSTPPTSTTDATVASTTDTTVISTTAATPPATYEFSSGDENVQVTIDTSNLSPGRHTLFVQATDSKGYKGPVATVFVDISRRRLRGS